MAGYVDAHALVIYGVFVSFMSGNTTWAGLHAGRGELAEGARQLLPLPTFMVGSMVGTFVVHETARAFRWLCALIASLLCLALAADLVPWLGWLEVVLLGLAMGILNSTVTRVGGQTLGVGYVTGDLNKIGAELALAKRRAPVWDGEGPWDTHGWRARLLLCVWLSFLLGAVAGGAAAAHLHRSTLLPPIALLVIAALR